MRTDYGGGKSTGFALVFRQHRSCQEDRAQTPSDQGWTQRSSDQECEEAAQGEEEQGKEVPRHTQGEACACRKGLSAHCTRPWCLRRVRNLVVASHRRHLRRRHRQLGLLKKNSSQK